MERQLPRLSGFDLRISRKGSSAPAKSTSKSKSTSKAGGQECPPHTCNIKIPLFTLTPKSFCRPR